MCFLRDSFYIKLSEFDFHLNTLLVRTIVKFNNQQVKYLITLFILVLFIEIVV